MTSRVQNTNKIREGNRILMKDDFRNCCPEFLKWLKSLDHFGCNPVDAMVLGNRSAEDGRTAFSAYLFTEKRIYHIIAHPRMDETDKGHLSAFVGNRMFRAGEDENWERGSYLADGSYSEKTWNCIMADIISYEMVRLGK